MEAEGDIDGVENEDRDTTDIDPRLRDPDWIVRSTASDAESDATESASSYSVVTKSTI